MGRNASYAAIAFGVASGTEGIVVDRSIASNTSRGFILITAASCLLYSVFSVYSVVVACKITTEYTDDTEKTRNKKDAA